MMFSSACYRNEVRIEKIPVGHLGGETCFQAINASIIRELIPRSNPNDTRLKKVTPDYENHIVVVEFRAREMALKNIERAIAKAGFTTYNTDGSVSVPAVGSPPQGCEKP